VSARPESGQAAESPVRESPAGVLATALPRQFPHEGGQPDSLPDSPAGAGVPGPPPDIGTDAEPAGPGDPAVLADAVAAETLLRCWAREMAVKEPEGGLLRIPLDSLGAELCVPVRHWSHTGTHRFGPPLLGAGARPAGPLDAVTLAALLVREASHTGRTGGDAATATPPATRPPRTPSPAASAALADHRHGAALVAQVADSVRRTATFLTERRADPVAAPGTSPFLEAEQSLVLGHPLHPTPKSREGLSESEARAYSPELRGAFPLHWMAVSRAALAADSAWTERGRTVPAERLARHLAGDALTARLPEDTVPLPLHPWQARELAHRPAVARLLADGLLHDLGPSGSPWYATSSLRTVVRPGTQAMLKLSLGVSITNSRRENLRKELLRGVEVHRLLRSGLGTRWRAAHPCFDIVRDPAWLGVRGPGGEPVAGLDTVIRHNPFGPRDDVRCVAGFTAPRPWSSSPRAPLRSALAETTHRLAALTGRPVHAVAAEWFLRYLRAVVSPVLWLDAHAGIALEAHQQNTLVLLDADGWPTGGRYRDNQGYYFRTSRRAELEERLPSAGLGVASDTFVDDAVADERFAYYLGVNNVFGLIGAFGAQGLAGEELLLAALRRFLAREACGGGAGPGRGVSSLPGLLLESRTLFCKANLLTRLHGMDELVGPVDTQSLYVRISNPLAR
jgi:siderophore synthetase component